MLRGESILQFVATSLSILLTQVGAGTWWRLLCIPARMKVVLAVFLACVTTAGAADVESTLTTRLVTNLNQFPCTRLLSATDDIGCSSKCFAVGPRAAAIALAQLSGITV